MMIITLPISDDEQQFGVVTDRAQGGSSLEVGVNFVHLEEHVSLEGWLS